jgi:hypothetical protein
MPNHKQLVRFFFRFMKGVIQFLPLMIHYFVYRDAHEAPNIKEKGRHVKASLVFKKNDFGATPSHGW